MGWIWIAGAAALAVLGFKLLSGRGTETRHAALRNKSVTRRSGAGNGKAGAARASAASRSAPPSGPYAAVSVRSGITPCAAALARENKRVLRSEAPTLPLEGCDAARCTCRLVHHDDRRSATDDRRMGIGLQSELYGASGEENRRGRRRGRRSTDI